MIFVDVDMKTGAKYLAWGERLERGILQLGEEYGDIDKTLGSGTVNKKQ